MNIFQMQCFLAVADALSFARAAESMNITQPSISHQIKMLETELNTTLFYRTTRKVSLTPSGKILMGDAREMVKIAQRAARRFEHPFTAESLPLRIGCHGFVHLETIIPLLDIFRKSHPLFSPEIEVIPFDFLFKLLEDDAFDVVFSFHEYNRAPASFDYQELLKVPIAAAVPSSNPLTDLKTLTEKDMNSENFIFFEKAPDIISAFQNKLLEMHIPGHIYYGAPDVQIAMVKSGFGIAIMAKTNGLEKNLGERACLVDIADSPLLSFGIFFKNDKGNLLLQDFLKCSREFLSDDDS